MSKNVSKQLSVYEGRALKKIHAWKTPELSKLERTMKVISRPLDKAGDFIVEIPGLGDGIKKAIGGIVSISNDVAQWSVRPEAVYKEFRTAGYDVHKRSDIFSLDLEDIDEVVGWLAAKYKGLAAAEGGVAGLGGLPGIAVDIPALVTLNLRAIGEYATYYGFDVSSQQERLFTMNVLGLAYSPKDAAAKQVAMAQLIRIAQDVAKKKTWKVLEKHAFVKIIQQISKALGIRLTKAKLAQALPIVSAPVGAAFNAYYTTKVCDAAYYLYQERFLAEKYGSNTIGVPVEPAETFDPGYEEQFEEIPGS